MRWASFVFGQLDWNPVLSNAQLHMIEDCEVNELVNSITVSFWHFLRHIQKRAWKRTTERQHFQLLFYQGSMFSKWLNPHMLEELQQPIVKSFLSLVPHEINPAEVTQAIFFFFLEILSASPCNLAFGIFGWVWILVCFGGGGREGGRMKSMLRRWKDIVFLQFLMKHMALYLLSWEVL